MKPRDTNTSVIIPNYWPSEDHVRMTHQCIRTLLENTDYKGQVVVVDDGSPIKYPQTLTIHGQKMVSLEKNSGYSTACNEGIKAADNYFLVLCNNDIEFLQAEWLEHLLKPLTMGYGISSIRCTEPDGWMTEDKITDNDKFGSLWCITRDAYDKLKFPNGDLLDPVFNPGYGEDLDLWHRAREAGIGIAKNHAGIAEHKGKATYNAMSSNDDHFQAFIPKYKRKWGDKAHLILTPQNSIVLYTDPELEDLGNEAKKYLDREVTVDDVNRMFNISW